MLTTVGGLMSCWRQTARRRGSIQKKKKSCINGIICCKNEKRKMTDERWKKDGRIASTKGESNDQECGRWRRSFAQDHEAHSMERRSADLEERRRGRKAFGLVKQRGKNGQSIGNVMKTYRTWKRGVEENGRSAAKAKTGVGCDGFHPKVPLDLTKETRREIVEFLEKVERSGKWPQQACTTMFFLIPKNVTSERPISLMPTLIRWWEALMAPEVAKWH